MGAIVKKFKIKIDSPAVVLNSTQRSTVYSHDCRTAYMRNGGIICVAVIQEGPRELGATYFVRTSLRHRQPGNCCCFMEVLNHETAYLRDTEMTWTETLLAPFPAGADFTMLYCKASAKTCELSGGANDSEHLILDISVVLRDTDGGQRVVEEETLLVNISKNPRRAFQSAGSSSRSVRNTSRRNGLRQ